MVHHSGVSLRTLAAWALILGGAAGSIVNLHPGYRAAHTPGFRMVPAAHTEISEIEGYILKHSDLLDPLVKAIGSGLPIDPTPEQRAAMDGLDAIAHQRDALWSRLQWHTDLDSALAQAKSRGVPVLSLRLLGRLDESMSCANSRYFRTMLYANSAVSQYMRNHFVLHWHTVREAPVLTVEFGDGRKLTQTITGNSIHYVISPDGQVVDALPGLYTPVAFLAELRLAQSASDLATAVIRIHRADPNDAPARFAGAENAAALATSKRALELPTLSAVTPMHESASPQYTASLGAGDNVFDPQSRSLALSQLTGTGMTADQIDRMLAAFEATACIDSARNRAELRPQVMELLADPSLRSSPTALDECVYDTVFLSPLTDPWAGLVDPDAFAGLWARDRFQVSPGG